MAPEDEQRRQDDRRQGERRSGDRRAANGSSPERERQLEQVRETQTAWAALNADRKAERNSRGFLRRRRKTKTR